MDNIELINQDYSNVSNAGRIHSNLIRLKKTSFAEVNKKYNSFRNSSVNADVESTNTEVSSEIGNTVVPSETVVESSVMTRLGDKIDIVPKSEIPTNFVGNRAIKLRSEMNSNLRSNSDGVYVSEEKEPEVNNEEYGDYGFTDFANTDFAVAAAADTSENEKVIDREKIADALNEEFDRINNANEEQVEVEEEVKDNSPTNDLSKLFENASEIKEEEIFDDELNTEEETNETTDASDYFYKPTTVEQTPVEEIVSEEIDGSLEETTKEREPLSNAYTPMTAEELQAARENIEYDKYSENVRDNIVVVPDKNKGEENMDDYTFVDDENMTFDYSEATAKDLENAFTVATSAQDLKAMIARAAELNAARAKSKAELEEAKKLAEEREQKRNQRMAMLKDYIAASEHDNELNIKMAEEEKQKASQFDREISEMEDMMKPFIEDDANNPKHIRVI